MFSLLKTLFDGSAARAEESARDHFALDLLEQKAREATAELENAKSVLASLILRQRNEERALQGIMARLGDLEKRVLQAMEKGRDDLAQNGASAIADLENEAAARKTTIDSLDGKITRLRTTIEKVHRRIIDLNQAKIEAKALDAEHSAQKRLNRTIGQSTALREAEALVQRIRDRNDPYEEAEILDGIETALTHADATDKLAAAGCGAKLKTTADDVLARLARQHSGIEAA